MLKGLDDVEEISSEAMEIRRMREKYTPHVLKQGLRPAQIKLLIDDLKDELHRADSDNELCIDMQNELTALREEYRLALNPPPPPKKATTGKKNTPAANKKGAAKKPAAKKPAPKKNTESNKE
jgi:hypothetical protein